MDVFRALLNNALVLIAVVFLYGELDFNVFKSKKITKIVMGLLIGAFTIIIMLNPWDTGQGVFYDTRTVLISVVGVFFGWVPTVIGGAIAIIFRLANWNDGAVAGSLSIFLTANFGVFWGKYRIKNRKKNLAMEYIILGFLSTILMLVSQLAIPTDPIAHIKTILLPVILIYPVATMLVSIALYNRKKRIEADKDLRKSEKMLSASIQGPKDVIIFILDKEYRLLHFNTALENVFWNLYQVKLKEDAYFLDFILDENSRIMTKSNIDQAILSGSNHGHQVYGFPGNQVHIDYYLTALYDEHGEVYAVSSIDIDMTNTYFLQNKLKQSETQYRLLIENMQLGLALHEFEQDDSGEPLTYRFLEVNRSFEELTGLKRQEVIGKTAQEVLSNTDPYLLDQYWKVAKEGNSIKMERYSSEMGKYFQLSIFSPKKNQFAVIIDDVSIKKADEERIKYLSSHDFLTGLKNRTSYESDLLTLDTESSLPLSFVIADINGLKLANDAFGHKVGDAIIIAIADILKQYVRESDSLSRIGGDEFVILMPRTEQKVAQQTLQKLAKHIEKIVVHSVDISVSFGVATKTKRDEKVEEIMKAAEREMYSQKLYEVSSNRSKTITTILNTLYVKNPREERHTARVSILCELFGKALNFRKDEVALLKTMGNLHDIGKIGIDSSILNKPDALTEEEFQEVKRHPEIGYRILSSTPEYLDIANDILYHHERVDGTGYPKGLKGNDIPYRSRIISICDAYDAMTSYRTYKRIMTPQDAIAELQKNKGKQFDAKLVDVFINKVLPNYTISQR